MPDQPQFSILTWPTSTRVEFQESSTMRLVNTKDIKVEFVDDDKVPKYAILSHTWEQEEVLFHDIGLDSAKEKKGYAKLESCCGVARANGFDYIWDDTCCIDKTSSAELSEAINSMYRYYQEADICYAYLADVSTIDEFSSSRWLTRGWTLQELIAPQHIIFFDKQWHELGTKTSLVDAISNRTSIPASILCDSEQLDTTSVAQRMSWAADRVTTRKEDRAYSLMGIFGINMPLLYGEGEKAFYRLQEEIMRVSDDHSLFAWRHPGTRGGLLAPTPSAFKDSGDIIPWNPFTPYNSPFTLTNKGVHMDAPFIAQDTSGQGICVLHCTSTERREQLIAVHLRDVYLTMEHFERCKTEEFQRVDLNNFSFTQYPVRSLCIRLQARIMTRNSRRDQVVIKSQPDKAEASTNGKRDILLSEAASVGDEGAVWFILAQADAFSGTMADQVRSVTCLAAQSGNERLLNQLMTRRDTSTFLTDSKGRTVLSHAAEYGHEAVVKLILSKAKVHPDARDKDGLTALWYAVKNGHGAASRLLIQTGLVSGNVGGTDGYQTALCYAARADDVELVKLLLQQKTLEVKMAESALFEAAYKGHLAIVELLVQNGVDINAYDDNRRRPLHIACRENHEDIVALLMMYGANADKVDAIGKTPLTNAAIRGNASTVKVLLENGADPEVCSVTELKPLHVACKEGHEDVVVLLMKHGASADKSDTSGKTPLADAALRGDASMVKVLLESGANPRAKCSNGKTAATYATGETKGLFRNKPWYETLLNGAKTS
ncbi:hypothetical protein FSARC_10936 [Fusarium sarcochroum]|uniref:Heterokaryon incompatibility domain-containing protein n=1 Tax=Fusarium sarcochroum TaxID=1208366 RepID=A0A8H4X2C5_9HYPO|nr:hypothetical protein FSARC_10936 [Fusarium sarcochroum]